MGVEYFPWKSGDRDGVGVGRIFPMEKSGDRDGVGVGRMFPMEIWRL